jgi:SAM-dependent methyltransferase
MREAAERLHAEHPTFRSVNGTAEKTALPAASVDLVSAMQAFHWFDPAPTAAEFSRILKPGGRVVLVWNERRTDASPFLRDYEALIVEHGTDYGTVRHENVTDERLRAFYNNDYYERHVLPNEQRFDYAGLRGRLESSSYVPASGKPGYEPMIAALERLFARHQRRGEVRIEYDTRIYFGRLGKETSRQS